MRFLVCSDAAMGLKHIHDNSVVHMDIKPENIFLKASGVFKVGDFGIAVRVPVTGGWEEGDGRYVAPELLRRSNAPTAAADVYSLGATILHSATGVLSRQKRTVYILPCPLQWWCIRILRVHCMFCVFVTRIVVLFALAVM